MAGVTVTTAANFIPEIWNDGVKNYLERSLVWEQVVDTSLNGLVKGQGRMMPSSQVTMLIIIAKLSGKPKSIDMVTRTEDYTKYSQGQSVDDEKI